MLKRRGEEWWVVWCLVIGCNCCSRWRISGSRGKWNCWLRSREANVCSDEYQAKSGEGVGVDVGYSFSVAFLP